jgi:hypothetical protein
LILFDDRRFVRHTGAESTGGSDVARAHLVAGAAARRKMRGSEKDEAGVEGEENVRCGLFAVESQ